MSATQGSRSFHFRRGPEKGSCAASGEGLRLEGEGDDWTEADAQIAADAQRILAPQLEAVHVERAGRTDRHTTGTFQARPAVDLDVIALGSFRPQVVLQGSDAGPGRDPRHICFLAFRDETRATFLAVRYQSMRVAFITSFGCRVSAVLKIPV